MPNEFTPILLSMLNHVIPATVKTFFLDAMNFRLGTTGLTFE